MLVNSASAWPGHNLHENKFFCQKPGNISRDVGFDRLRTNQLSKYLIEVTADILGTLYECEKDTSYEGIPLREFITRIVLKSQIPTNNILCALLYLVRLKQRHPSCKGISGSGNRLFLAALIVANKFLYDNAYLNCSWVPIADGLFTVKEINLMEFELLYFLNFRLNVTKDQWINFVQLIDRRVTESWRQSRDVVPDKMLYIKATTGIDDPIGESSCLPSYMKAVAERRQQPQRHYQHPNLRCSAVSRRSLLSQESASPTGSFSSYDSSPRTPSL